MKLFLKPLIAVIIFTGIAQSASAEYYKPFGKSGRDCTAPYSDNMQISDEMMGVLQTVNREGDIHPLHTKLESIAIREIQYDVFLFQIAQCELMAQNEPYYDHCPVGDIFKIDDYAQSAFDEFHGNTRTEIIEFIKTQDNRPVGNEAFRAACRHD